MATIYQLHWVLRWPKAQHLRGISGQVKKAWELARGKRSWGHREVWDARRRCGRRVGVVAVPVFDLAVDAKRWLVVARPGTGREPWYLLTTECVETEEQAWRVVFAYARRWQVEMTIRFDKSELAFASLRVRIGRPAAKFGRLRLSSMRFCFPCSPHCSDRSVTGYYAIGVIGQDSGAEKSQLHCIVYVLPCLDSGWLIPHLTSLP